MKDADLGSIERHLGDLVAMYRLVHADTIRNELDALLKEGTRKSVWEKCDGDTSGAEIAREIGVTPQRVSQILTALAEVGLLTRRSEKGFYERRLST